jgi:hypothetical protein
LKGLSGACTCWRAPSSIVRSHSMLRRTGQLVAQGRKSRHRNNFDSKRRYNRPATRVTCRDRARPGDIGRSLVSTGMGDLPSLKAAAEIHCWARGSRSGRLENLKAGLLCSSLCLRQETKLSVAHGVLPRVDPTRGCRISGVLRARSKGKRHGHHASPSRLQHRFFAARSLGTAPSARSRSRCSRADGWRPSLGARG